MAEAWRLEEDEEELKEVGRRHRRGNLNPATDRSERNKPDHRSSGQGPLSSIKAAIKRTSRTSGHSEQQRDRRRPEITIVAAEPLGPSWFPGGNHVTPQGLVFQSSHTQASWRTNDLVPAEPPSYEQVIKEINQVQVNTTSNNNAASAANSRCTATSSTQTDFPEEIISNLPEINVKSNLHTASECKSTPAVQIPRKPPRPSSSLLNNNHAKNEELLVVLEEQPCREKPDAVVRPVPKPRTKGNLKPAVRYTQNTTEDNQNGTSQSRSDKDASSLCLESLLDDNFWDGHMVVENMDSNNSQNSIVSKIKVFEMQGNMDTAGLTKKPEVSPRSVGPKPIISAKKPVLAPKPGAIKASDEWDLWTESKLKAVPQERPLQPQEGGNNITTKPELPKKPKPAIVKSSSSGQLNSGSKQTSDNSDGQRKSPVPAPRPLVLTKSISFENPALPILPLKPANAAPRLSIAAQTSAFRSLVEPPSVFLSPPVPSTTCVEGDLISFDDDVLPLTSTGNVQELAQSESDLINMPSKQEPLKEQTVQPAVVRKPTVIRIPSKPAKVSNETQEGPPPLPTEKPVGNTSGISTEKLKNIKTTPKMEAEHSNLTQLLKNVPILPPRPSEGKIVPARPPPPKGAPGRPPPPKSAKSSSQTEKFSRSSSDMTLHKKTSMFGLSVKRTKSDVINILDPALPPRPKPGHPLYSKYMLPVLHGTAKEDVSVPSTGRLSSKQEDVLVPVNKVNYSRTECQKGDETGKGPLSQMQIITPPDESLKSRQRESENTQPVSEPSAPHAVVLHDFLAEHTEDLGLNSGETVYLLEKIDNEWYRGKCRNCTGIFPASFVKVIVDISEEESNRKKVHVSSPSIVGPRCVARFEYIGDQKDELSFLEGDIILLKEYVNEEWAKGELRANSGIFPLNFVEIIEDLPESGSGTPLKNKTEVEGHDEEWCDALHDFTAETQEDLSFKKGDRILILEHVDSEWYRGRLNGKEGIFPAVFVRLCSGGIQLAQTQSEKKGKAKALYDFHAENIDELSFKVGDLITGLETVDEEWMSGELNGKSGIFPKNFVHILQFSCE